MNLNDEKVGHTRKLWAFTHIHLLKPIHTKRKRKRSKNKWKDQKLHQRKFWLSRSLSTVVSRPLCYSVSGTAFFAHKYLDVTDLWRVSCGFGFGLHAVCLRWARVTCIIARVEIANGFTLRLRYDRHNTDGFVPVTLDTVPHVPHVWAGITWTKCNMLFVHGFLRGAHNSLSFCFRLSLSNLPNDKSAAFRSLTILNSETF